jgi:hypothetical protein
MGDSTSTVTPKYKINLGDFNATKNLAKWSFTDYASK